MKTLNILIITLFTTLSVQMNAQILLNNKDLLKKELDSTLNSQNLALNSLAVSPAGDWIILFGEIGYSFVQTAPTISETLKKNNTEKNYLKDIDFYENAGWSLITKHNAYNGNKIPKHIKTKLKAINQAKQTIKCLDFNTTGKGFILFGYNSFYGKDLPSNFKAKMYELQRRNQEVKYASINENGAWVILYGKYGFACYKTPLPLIKKLKELAKQKTPLERIFLFGEYWVLTTENAKIYNNL